MTSDSESLFDKLKSMGVQLGAGYISQPTPPVKKEHHRGYPIEEVVKGFDFTTMYGPAFVIEEQYLPDYQHGGISLCFDCSLDILSSWGNTAHLTDPSLRNVVFLDTETSGLAGGTGTYAFQIGIGYRNEEGFHLVQFFMRDPSQETALLAALHQWLQPFDVVVTFNGRTFDIPLLNTRYVLNGLSSPFGSIDHLDLLPLARKLWRDSLPSRALGELEKEIVHFYRTGEEVPGWLVPQLYFDYLRTEDARPLGGVFYHNAMDILSLASLFNHMSLLLENPANHARHFGLDLAAIARLYEEMGWLERAASLYEASIEKRDMPDSFFFKTIERYALMRRRQGDWEKSVQLWQVAAEHGYWSACVELAKFHEHRDRDYNRALYWSQRAVELLDGFFTFESTRRAEEKELRQRITRILRKLDRSSA